MSDTLAVFQPETSRLNRTAFWNMLNMRDALATFHLLTSWLKALATLNTDRKEALLATFHAPIGWLKAVTSLKTLIMSVTLATFQLAMLSLKVAERPVSVAEKSAFALLDTALTSQAPIAPYVVVAVAGDAIQLVTAVTTFVFVIDVTAPANEAERKISTNAPKAVALHVLAADPGGDPTRTSH